ncbi:hypothetical protein D5086_016493 [Populus alba]|uniref:Uncharacterized protein n=1 Tax=Populus alba TaxID=43335 RepID=A0ACC4BUV0_POPAL
MIGGNTRDESSIRFQKQAHVERQSHEQEDEDGAYVSKPGRQKGPHISCLNKRNRQMDFQVDGDRQKGSRISLFGGRQMGPPHIFMFDKRESPDGIPNCLRSPEGISYFDEGRQKGPHISCLNKRNCQMGFQVDGDRQKGSRISLFGGRQMGPHISCLIKRNRQMGFQVV